MPITATEKICTSPSGAFPCSGRFPHDLLGTLSYVGSKGTFLLITSYVNLIDPAIGLRPIQPSGRPGGAAIPTEVRTRASSPVCSAAYPWAAVFRQLRIHHELTRIRPEAEIPTILKTPLAWPASAPRETSTHAMS